MKEIISIQAGGYANFVGSHFWNLQDELMGLQSEPQEDPSFLNCGVNFDVLHRVGETPQGLATYTPRLLAIDSRGSLGAVKATGSLYEQPPSLDTSSVTSWRGQVSRHISEPHAKNEFLESLEQEELEWKAEQAGKKQNDPGNGSIDRGKALESKNTQQSILESLEDSVQFWTDYSKVHFHPLSLYELEGVWHGITPLDNFGSGKGLLKGFIKEEALDRLRFFVEEADQLQGLQVLVDDSNGFAGVAADLLEGVVDDYSKTPVLLFTVRPPSSFKKPRTFHASTVRELHNAVSFSELSSFSQCMIPLGLSSFAKVSRYLHLNDTKDFHTSAVYASAVSCITLPLRMEHSGQSSVTNQMCIGGMDMASLIHVLSGQMGRRVSILDLAMPAPPVTGYGKLESVDFSRFQPLTSHVSDSDDEAALEAFVVQGALLADSGNRASLQDVLSCYGRKHKPPCHLAASLCPLALPLPFPNLLGPMNGSRREMTRTGSDISSIPIAARLRASAAILPYLERRFHSLKKVGGASFGWQILEGWGLQKDEVRELGELTSNILAAYGSTIRESASDSE